MTDQLIDDPDILTGMTRGKYAGEFPGVISKKIIQIVKPSILHLFSGSSKIGNVRVDLGHDNATINMDVYKFIQEDPRDWNFVILDPDYHISRKDVKLKGHARIDSVSGNVLAWRLIEDYLRTHADNVIWFDLSAPCPKGFYRKQIWLYLQGGYHHARVLSWLKREGARL